MIEGTNSSFLGCDSV